MSTKVLEEVVVDLQRRVKALELKDKKDPRAGWKRAYAKAKEDTHFSAAVKLGAQWRSQANKEGW